LVWRLERVRSVLRELWTEGWTAANAWRLIMLYENCALY
jgi:hypothetical protein